MRPSFFLWPSFWVWGPWSMVYLCNKKKLWRWIASQTMVQSPEKGARLWRRGDRGDCLVIFP